MVRYVDCQSARAFSDNNLKNVNDVPIHRTPNVLLGRLGHNRSQTYMHFLHLYEVRPAGRRLRIEDVNGPITQAFLAQLYDGCVRPALVASLPHGRVDHFPVNYAAGMISHLNGNRISSFAEEVPGPAIPAFQRELLARCNALGWNVIFVHVTMGNKLGTTHNPADEDASETAWDNATRHLDTFSRDWDPSE